MSDTLTIVRIADLTRVDTIRLASPNSAPTAVQRGEAHFRDGRRALDRWMSCASCHAGGHTAGLQVVRVMTKRGWVVLASDALHYYEHHETNRLYTTAFHLGEMVDAYRTVERLAASDHHIVP